MLCVKADHRWSAQCIPTLSLSLSVFLPFHRSPTFVDRVKPLLRASGADDAIP